MLQLIQANWLVFVAVLLIGIAVAYWLFVVSSRPAKRDRRPDVLDEGAAPAQRNQALIDAPPAASFGMPSDFAPPPMAGTMAGIGEVVAAAAMVETQRAHEPPQTIAAEPDATPAEGSPADGAPDLALAAIAQPDDLRRIKGLGPKMQAVLTNLGITTYAQIASWTDADLDHLDTKLGAFAGRPRRDNWVEQARLLSSGDTGAYEAKFGKI
ncbi:hypothetical protein WSK_2122 [Novosphingobium sp. Rr 2-17]|uniref:hypothetical protein n=1 Tax=Novosphingobium sp. Rr 2-17 TaxID=555793 RepID=UPI0002698ECF|nr:hypothetical protein WSK_2122 [Novosphingobium sp. Rr 2-17]